MVTEGPVVAEQVVKIDEPRRRMASMAGSPAQLENATRDLFRLSGGQSIPVEARVPSAEPKPKAAAAAAKPSAVKPTGANPVASPAARQPEPAPASEQKKEASILFSLESLMKAAPADEKAEQPDEHLWNMRAESPLFGTAQDHALLTTPLDPPPRSAAMDSMTMSSRRPSGVRLWPLLLAVVGGCALILGAAAWIVLKPTPPQHVATLDTPVERTAVSGDAPTAEPGKSAAPVAAPAAAPAAAPGAALVKPTAAVEPAAGEEKAEKKDEEAKQPAAAEEAKQAATKASVPSRATGSAKKPVPPRATKAAAGPFNVEAAKTALNTAATKASSCSGASGKGKVQLTFAPSGKVSSAELTDGPFAGTPAGKCALKHFKAAHVPPFSGAPQTVAKSFKIP